MKTKNLWKKAILILTCAGLVAGGTFTYLTMDFNREMVSPATWQSYSPSDDRFGVQFPIDPKESHEEMVIANKRIQFHQFSTEHEKAFYAVSYLDFPGHWKWLGTNKLLTKSFDMLLENEPNVEELLQKNLSTHEGYPSLEYRLKQDGKEVQGKFVIAGNTLYRVAITYPLALGEKIHSDAFLDSFTVKS